MNTPLFARPYEDVDWEKVLKLDGRTAYGRAFEMLLRQEASAIELSRPEIAGLDYRRRISDLRDMNIPVHSKGIDGKPYSKYYIPILFKMQYWEMRRRMP